jgi:endonuclease G, mitochondrial
MSWRIAESLLQLRKQVNAAYPNRSKASDGGIGDAAHATRASDHNPWVKDGAMGVVTAVDVTHDPANGCDAGKLAAALVNSEDPRIKYVIWNRQMASSYPANGVAAWTWRPYSGANPHNHHVHISVQPEKELYDSPVEWEIGDGSD